MNTATYKVAIGPVTQSKLPPGDPSWSRFNASFVNQEVLEQLQIADSLYTGRPITTWHKDHWRTSANYLCGQHIGMDFDTCDKRSSLPYLLNNRFISKFGSMVYTTPSHSPDAPRARVLFLLDQPIYQSQNYVLATTALLWIFGTADRQCKDPVRFFYGGRPGVCRMEWIGNELPLALVKDLIARYRASGCKQQRKSTRYETHTADEAEIVDALKHIDAWGISYDQWVAVLMALHSELPGANGLQIAENWAQGYPGEVELKWKSFKPDGNVSGRIGIGTLFALAREHGWQGDSRNPKSVPVAVASL